MRKRRISAILAMTLSGSKVLARCRGSDFTPASEAITQELGEEMNENTVDYVKHDCETFKELLQMATIICFNNNAINLEKLVYCSFENDMATFHLTDKRILTTLCSEREFKELLDNSVKKFFL